jgi:hypothetical protein
MNISIQYIEIHRETPTNIERKDVKPCEAHDKSMGKSLPPADQAMSNCQLGQDTESIRPPWLN